MDVDHRTDMLSQYPEEMRLLGEMFDCALVERQWGNNCEAAEALAARIADLHQTGVNDADDLLAMIRRS
jgi:hypothetical protein